MGRQRNNLLNQKFGELTVIRDLGRGNWECLCSCGKTKIYKTYTLTHGDVLSCGHVKKQALDDLTGKHFNHWTVLNYEGGGYWKCECDCINKTIKSVRRADLISGKSKSCGCSKREDILGQVIGDFEVIDYNNESYKWVCKCNKCGEIAERTRYELINRNTCNCLNRTKHEDLSNKEFGEWTVIRYLGNSNWECKCSCGKIKSVQRYELITGKSTNCGHKRHLDLTNKRFGRLVVNKYLGNTLSWECTCDCGNKINVLTCNLINGNTKSCGCLKNESFESKEDYINAINKFIKENGYKPYITDISKIIGRHKENIRHNLDKYNLWGYLNKTFGSRFEAEIYNICTKYIAPSSIIMHDRTVISPQELDIYIPEKKVAIEFNGNYWHSSESVDKKYHQQKTIACARKGIQLIHIFEYEWDNLNKQLKLEKLLKSKFTAPDNVIYARNTELRTVSDEESKEFLNKYHLQGYTYSRIKLGLYHDNELVSLLTLGNPRFNSNYSYEIIRYCKHPDYAVTGGIEKLFKHFKDRYKPDSIITYTDFSKFNGKIYTRIGFKYIQQNPVTEPNYVWINEKNNLVLTRYKTQKQKLLKLGLGTEDQSETEIMRSNGYIQIFDCGNIKLEWKDE